MEKVKVLHHLIVMVMCFVCFVFSVGMCSDSDILIKSYVSSSQPSGELVDSAKDERLPSITGSDWNSLVLESKLPVLVMFTADLCLPCPTLNKFFARLVPRYTGRAKFYSFDASKDDKIPTQYGIRVLPTTIIFKGGEVKDTLIGFSLRTLKAFIDRNL